MPSPLGGQPSKELGDWTSQHDIQLLKLKDVDSRKWIDIVIILSRHKKALVQRYNELKKAQEEAAMPKSISTAPELRTVLDMDSDSWSATDPTDAIDFDPAELQPVLEVAGVELNLREVRLIWSSLTSTRVVPAYADTSLDADGRSPERIPRRSEVAVPRLQDLRQDRQALHTAAAPRGS